VSWERVTCVTVACDGCGDGWTDSDTDAVPHYPDREAALDGLSMAGWTLDPTRVLCGDCTVLAVCERAGHDWLRWRPAGPLPLADGVIWQGRIRCCSTCPDSQWDPPLDTLRTAAPVVDAGSRA
jgi:hypothetical protein